MSNILAARQVAEAVQALLLGTTSAGASAFIGRNWPIAAEALPALRVIEGEEDTTADGIHWPQPLQHELQLGVEVLVAGLDPDAEADALAGEVLAQVFSTAETAHLEPLPNCTLELQGLSRQPAIEGQAVTARLLVRLLARYQTQSNDPFTLI